MTPAAFATAPLTPHELAAWRGLLEEHTRVTQELDTRATHRDGIRRFFLDHLTATDQIVLGDVWTRLR